jgi:hypothetical protein
MDAVTDWRKDVQRAFFFADGASPSVVAFDIVVSESHTSDLEITDNPVETGVVVSDHAFAKPDTLELVLMVSDTLLTPALNPDPFSSIISRAATGWNWLKGLQKSAVPFEVQTGLQLYQNQLIGRLSAMQDKDKAGVLIVTASLREVQIVSTQTVTFPPRKAGKTTRQASAPVDQGNVATTPVTAQSTLLNQALSQLIPGFSSNPSKYTDFIGQ